MLGLHFLSLKNVFKCKAVRAGDSYHNPLAVEPETEKDAAHKSPQTISLNAGQRNGTARNNKGSFK
jgi:hypothetical protein